MKHLMTVLIAAFLIVASSWRAVAQDRDTLVSVASSKNPHGPIALACNQCHSTGQWTTLLSPMLFDHNAETGFPLEGLHKSVSCKACHASLTFRMKNTECYQCHDDVHKGQLGNDCKQCHTTSTWLPHEFNHSQTRFPLLGRHATTNCQSCHTNQKENEYAGLSNQCITCHAVAYQSSRNPDHVANAMGTDCETCHTTTSWTTTTIKDHGQFGFALTLAHGGQTCQTCHAGHEFAATSRECVTCHLQDFQSSINPNHLDRQFSDQCEDCHTAAPGWKPATFDHSATTFPLTGAHLTAQGQCQACHADEYRSTPTDCFACHQSDYTAAIDPNHVTNAFSTACATCHTTTPGWTPATFDHALTDFVLTGAHLIIQNQCTSCHASGFANTPTECYACHQADYNSTTSPNHVTAGYSTHCDHCHTTNPGWTPVNFSHDNTSFPLTGAHLLIQDQCQACHANGYANTPTDCYACHQSDYTSALEPNHVANSFPTACANCHTTNPGWAPATFDHSLSDFPLTGAHLTIQNQCISCHAGGYTNTPTDCYACHQSDFTSAVDPNHVTNNFSTACGNCHTTNPGWAPATFDHSGTTFPLTGAHLTVQDQCVLCHAGGYNNTPTDCYACHQTDYTSATSPDHPGLVFPTACQGCHQTSGWLPSTFNHATYTGYTLQGAHANIASQCAQCHIGNLTNATANCYSCHAADFDGTTNPNHAGSGFSHECQTCHSQNAWIPWTVNHNIYFPIYSGFHQAQWVGCGGGSGDGSGCHTVSSNYQIFSCIHCHDHNQADMNSEHDEVSGYSYNSAACYNCHPNGEGVRVGRRNIKSFQ